MIPNKAIATLLLVLSSHGALAANQGPETQIEDRAQPSDEDVHAAISILLETGVIEIQDDKIHVKEPSALQRLRERGRVQRGEAEMASICI